MSELPEELSGPRILVVDDEPANIEVLCQSLEVAGYQVMVAPSGAVALDLAERFVPDLILLDVVMPGLDGFTVCRRLKQAENTESIPVLFLTARDDTADLVEGFNAGGVDYVVKPFRKEEVLIRIRTHLEKARLERELRQKNAELEAEITQRQVVTSQRNQLADRISLADQREAQRWAVDEFVGESQTLKKILQDIDLLHSAEHTSVLILGESGTGKELIARAIHSGGTRSEGPFVPVNCASLPRELADSLLFGHVKGSFTGADRDQAGYFEMADGGTLFLDELGTMPAELQPKLLRVLEDHTVQPLGGREPHQVNVRVLAATNADLATQVEQGDFRQDLYYRLARFTVSVPPLRERREDIALLVRHFLQMFAEEMNIESPGMSDQALALLETHRFPGNVRELKNLVERALIESRGVEIGPQHLPLMEVATSTGPAAIDALPLNLEQAELLLIQRALDQSEGNISAAARLLGIERTKIYRRLNQIQQYTPPAEPT